MRKLIIATVLMMWACNGEPPPPPPPTCDVWSAPEECVCSPEEPFAPALGVCALPRVDRPVDYRAVRGVTGFSLALRSIHGLVDATNWIHESGWNTWRVGAQTTHDWCNMRSWVSDQGLSQEAIEEDLLLSMLSSNYLPCGPYHGTQEWRDNLIRMLDVTARIPDTWVQLIPTFTYKSHNECNQREWREDQEGCQAKNIIYFNKMFDRVNEVVQQGDYKHVVYEVFNEVVHPLSQHIKDEDVREMFLHIKANSNLPVGTDYHGGWKDGKWRGRYPFVWRDVSNYLALHTPRNPEPTLLEMQAIQDKYKYRKPMWIDETVCWASDEAILLWSLEGRSTIALEGRGTEDERMWSVVKHLRDVHEMGWRPFYHSIWGIHNMHLGRLPNYDRDIAKE